MRPRNAPFPGRKSSTRPIRPLATSSLTASASAYGASCSLLLTIVITQLVGADQAGIFSLAFVTGTLLMIIGNYGVRTYQVSDIDEDHSFADYQINRIITCILMVAAGYVYCCIRGYESDMFVISMGVYLYRMVDALADVYEGRLQQVDKMYLAGISQAFRSAVVLVVFSIVLLSRATWGSRASSWQSSRRQACFVLTVPLAYMETPKSRRWDMGGVINLFKRCFPVFVAPLPLLPHRQHAQVHDGRTAFLR